MGFLDRTLRKELEAVVRRARRCADAGARQALAQLAVGEAEPFATMGDPAKALRRRLRAHGRQLGDRRDDRSGIQATARLADECAYEHWHRLLFARFLAENQLLIEPESGMALSLDECRELARERGVGGERIDWLQLASGFAQRMLPAVFRADDPVLAVALPPEARQELEALVAGLPTPVFTADDSLGWTYQFWQAEAKDVANQRGDKIDASTLPAVTQLFTEDYMVEFLLHNTLGAWWTAKRHAEGRDQPIPFAYLRLAEDGTPAAGSFPGWPRTVRELRVLDPCMGSGHFLVTALPLLARMRELDDGLAPAAAVVAVLRDNLVGLELDPRCTQIAAFALTLAAWKLVGHQALPSLQLACSGLAPNATLAEWTALAGEDARQRAGLERLWRLFQQAPVLGSLIDPGGIDEDAFSESYAEIKLLLQTTLQAQDSELAHEVVATAKGITEAAALLDTRFHLVLTNVPYLTAKKQAKALQDHCVRAYPRSWRDVATCMIERCAAFTEVGGSMALVTPQNWMFLGTYGEMRSELLRQCTWRSVVRLGPGAFQTIGGEVVKAALVVLENATPPTESSFLAIDALALPTVEAKARHVQAGPMAFSLQADQQANPDARISLIPSVRGTLLARFAAAPQGVKTGDDDRWRRCFWENAVMAGGWIPYQSTVDRAISYGGREYVLDWGTKGVGMVRPRVGNEAVTRLGVAVSQIGDLQPTLYTGERFDSNVAALVPSDATWIPALWAFCSSPDYAAAVRRIDQKLNVTNATLVKVPFDLAHWQRVAAERYPHGLPAPHSSDPTQWLFNGHPKDSDDPLQVAVARLVGYRWPRQTGSSFPDCPALSPDGLEGLADADGIVCLPAVAGEPAAAERVQHLLAAAYGADWSADRLGALLAAEGHPGLTLDAWLRDAFFADHCDRFHHRPFVWQVWDGLPDGFAALVDYHRLAGPAGQAEQTLNKLAFTCLGHWIRVQREAQAAGTPGADLRLAAALHLQRELEKIRDGEPPYDLFVRWKPLHRQPIGWQPDLDDGVRLNLRPFLAARPLRARAKKACILRETPRGVDWDKDRGKEPERAKADFPWFWSYPGEADAPPEDFPGGATFDCNRWNDCHYTRAAKERARARAAAKGSGA
jgi:hypothetical protein